MLSMTGFGTGQTVVDDTTVTVELRSVNHRFLDVALKLPPVLMSFEIDVRNVLKARIARGRVTCVATIEQEVVGGDGALSSEAIDHALGQLDLIANRIEAAGNPRPVPSLQDVFSVPDLYRGSKDTKDAEVLRKALLEAIETACVSLLDMKTVEGNETVNELRGHLETVSTNLGLVNKLVPEALKEAQIRLTERLDALLGESLEPQRLAQEAAILVDKGNINEECERLASHLEQVSTTLADGGQVAKRLNFLLQEMHREVNTMGSKTQNMDITTAVISMKEAVESMREQVMNLE
jgi:uncharacterized protein (TIGR00255 family)